ncbi:MAG: peptide ABC transporter substrate-binding protein [Methylotenera sp.]|nr:peptide ABC transporter substrate-binding protein [Oligoflexia bacterium]
MVNDPVSLDPTLVEDGGAFKVVANTMQGLVGYDGAGKLQNQLAESAEISRDGLQYTFVLKAGARWTDGKPVLAQDFVTSIQRALKPGSRSRLAGLLSPIRGAEEFHAGRSQELGVHADPSDPKKLVIQLGRKATYFLQALALPLALPLRADILSQNQDQWPETGPSTGFYRLASHRRDQELVFEKNIWAPASAPARVIMTIVQDESTAASLFDQGKIDVLSRISALDQDRYRKSGLLHTDPLSATYFLSFNLGKPPFNQRDFRRAVAGALDRKELTHLLGSGETPARSWIPVGIEGYQPFEDPRPLFKDAFVKIRGQLQKKPMAPVAAAFDTSSRNSLVMEKIQHDLLQVLGLRLSLSNQDWKSYLGVLFTDPAPLYRFGWLAPFLDPAFHLHAFVTGDPFNLSKWSNPVYDELNRRIEAAEPGPERDELLRRAQKIVVEDEAIVIPLYHYVQNTAVSARVQGFRINPVGVVRFEDLSLRTAP